LEKFEIDQIEMSKRKAKLDETDHPNRYNCLLMNFDEQVQRIKEKLVLVRAKESKTQVFGAENHQYKLAEPYSQTMVLMFESEHHITVPEAFRAFITQIGASGAGPYYGINELNKTILTIPTNLSKPCQLHPKMTDDEWKTLTVDQEDNEEEDDPWFHGLMSIGIQGCAFETCLVVNGPYRGRIVNIDFDLEKPQFTFEAHFLDWYERWLDEILNSYDMSWFGFKMGGNDLDLIRFFQSSSDSDDQAEAIWGFSKLPQVHLETIDFIEKQMQHSEKRVRDYALWMLTKFAYEKAKPYIARYLESALDEDKLVAAKGIHWYAKSHSVDWVDTIIKNLPGLNHPETFVFLCYVLSNSKVDFGPSLIPFLNHQEASIRKSVIHNLGKLENKQNYIAHLIQVFDDEDPYAQIQAIQATRGIIAPELVGHYERLISQNKDKWVVINASVQLKELKLALSSRINQWWHRFTSR
jgi:hypothetical protein